MSIVAGDLLFFGAASMPQDDVSTTGGAIDTTVKVEFTQFTANAVAEAVSDGADARNLTITGRNAAGAIVSETLALNGVTPVAFVTTWERIIKAVLASGSGTRIVTIKQGVGGTVRITLGLNIVTQRALFYDSASESSIAVRMEKMFAKNNHGTLTLNAAGIRLTADPTSRIRIGAAPSKGDSATTANRKAVPSSVTFVDDNVLQGVPTGALAAGEVIGIWAEQNLPANDPANRTTFTAQLEGTTV